MLAVASALGCGDFSGERALYLTDEQFGPCGDCDQFRLAPAPPDGIDVLTYNVFLRPGTISAVDSNDCRARRIGQWLNGGGADIVALQETFDAKATAMLGATARYAHPFQVLSLPSKQSRLGTSGGLSILSRWPIESVRTLVYDDCRGAVSDCVAAKGAVHAIIRVSEDERVQVVATHLDAGSSKANREARAGQLAQLRGFIDEIDPDDGPVVTMGDFNVDSLSGDGEFEDLVELLEVDTDTPRERPSTLNCKMNILCRTPPPAERLDYVFTALRGDRFDRLSTEHLRLADDGCEGANFLSDHRAVRSALGVDW